LDGWCCCCCCCCALPRSASVGFDCALRRDERAGVSEPAGASIKGRSREACERVVKDNQGTTRTNSIKMKCYERSNAVCDVARRRRGNVNCCAVVKLIKDIGQRCCGFGGLGVVCLALPVLLNTTPDPHTATEMDVLQRINHAYVCPPLPTTQGCVCGWEGAQPRWLSALQQPHC
jgi:hypothetical protein